jgi:multiple sugar transport system permease protein/raffinose/stachyose/melibiose transport system permease protein
MSANTTAAKRERRRAHVPPPLIFALVLIPFAAELIGVYWPAIQGVLLSFTRWNGLGTPEPVGLQNYTALFTEDPVFITAVKNTAIWVVLFGTISYVGGLAIALLFQSERRGVGIYRTALFLPTVVSIVVTSLIWSTLYQPTGLLNTTLQNLGVIDDPVLWLGNEQTALYAIIVASLWREIGYIMVLLIAGLKALDPELNNAAKVDGANSWQRFWHITFPQLRSVNLVILSILIIDSLRSFDFVWTMTRGGPYNSSQLLSSYMFTMGVESSAYGYGSAIAVVILLLSLGVIVSYLVRAIGKERES